jgi:hypothetical protein
MPPACGTYRKSYHKRTRQRDPLFTRLHMENAWHLQNNIWIQSCPHDFTRARRLIHIAHLRPTMATPSPAVFMRPQCVCRLVGELHTTGRARLASTLIHARHDQGICALMNMDDRRIPRTSPWHAVRFVLSQLMQTFVSNANC